MADPAFGFKGTLTVHAFGRSLQLEVAHGLFSTQRIDEGTQLLLGHLPDREPGAVLDLGCGYGALGLPIAARFPAAALHLVDRSLLAVEYARRNAERNGLRGAQVYPSLGYRDLGRHSRFDWVLCNVPARSGERFLSYLLQGGRSLLAPGGEVRMVVIRDLAPVVERLRLPLRRVVDGPRHSVFAVGPGGEGVDLAGEDIYTRDLVRAFPGPAGELERPHDLEEDPHLVPRGLPLLLDVLPRRAPRTVLVGRCGYGATALAALARWPECRALATDLDLLATAFARRNAARAGFAERMHAEPALSLARAAGNERYELVVSVVWAPAGEAVARAEAEEAGGLLAPGGQALVLARARGPQLGIRVAERDGYVVCRI